MWVAWSKVHQEKGSAVAGSGRQAESQGCVIVTVTVSRADVNRKMDTGRADSCIAVASDKRNSVV